MSQSSNQPNRLNEGGRIDRSRRLTFTFNGKRYHCLLYTSDAADE